VILLIIFLVLTLIHASAAAAQPPAATATTARWLDLQTLSVTVRHRRIVDSADQVRKNQLQEKTQFRARLKLDAAAHYTVNVGVFSGNGFTSSWNSTGIGTDDFTGAHEVKQLFLSAKPIAGLELQYGGLYVDKGVSTEITYYDEDAYLVGERVLVTRPKQLFFDEILATLGSRGDLKDSNVFRRFKSLDDTDYRQLQATRAIGPHAQGSLDYTYVDAVSTLRPAVTVQLPDVPGGTQIRLEAYHRYGNDPATGFDVEGGGQIQRVRVSVGYADIDPVVGRLNGDRYTLGKRVYANASVPLVAGFSLSFFATHTVGDNPPVSNKFRTDVLLGYNVLPALRKTRAF
jgi:hypothetical protein